MKTGSGAFTEIGILSCSDKTIMECVWFLQAHSIVTYG